MEVIEELSKLDSTLTNLKRDLNTQINLANTKVNEFHKMLIDLSTKYPEHKELLEFVVFVNDKIETNQTNVKEIIIESLNDIISLKKEIIKQIIISRKKPFSLPSEEVKKGFFDKITSFAEIKFIVVVVLIIVLILSFITAPDATVNALQWVSKIIL